MAINSKVILCKGICIDRNYTNVLDYNETQMLALCNSKKVAERNNYSFVKDSNNTISTDFDYSDVLTSNYIAFQNQRYSNKWFFAWIDKAEYINDGVTRISFTVDYWSTWFGYWSIRPCFTIREHVADDTIGKHTVDENLDVGRVESTLTTMYDFGLTNACYICIASDYDPENDEQFSGITIHNNIVSGHKYYLIKIEHDPTDPTVEETSYFNLALFLYQVNYKEHIEDVKDIFIIPEKAFDSVTLDPHSFQVTVGVTPFTCYYYLLPASFSPRPGTWNIGKVTSFNDLPNIQNNKCYCYPYNYLYITNNVGNKNIYKYEDFSDSTNATFSTEFAVCIGGSGRLVPNGFKGVTNNYDESLPLAKYPVCGWTADSYTNWLTQNSVNIATALTLAGTAVAGVGGLTAVGALEASEVGAMAMQSLPAVGTGIAGLINKFNAVNLLPNIEGGGQNNGDINYSAKTIGFVASRMRATPEYMTIIDNYFTKYGYKVNRLKIPEISSRQNWNYVQIGPEDIIGIPTITQSGSTRTTPEDAFLVINNIARKGVTIWHNHENVGNYNLTNPIVT